MNFSDFAKKKFGENKNQTTFVGAISGKTGTELEQAHQNAISRVEQQQPDTLLQIMQNPAQQQNLSRPSGGPLLQTAQLIARQNNATVPTSLPDYTQTERLIQQQNNDPNTFNGRVGKTIRGGLTGTAAGLVNTGGTLLDIIRTVGITDNPDLLETPQPENSALLQTAQLIAQQNNAKPMESLRPSTNNAQQQTAQLIARQNLGTTDRENALISDVTRAAQREADRLQASSEREISEAKEGLGTIGQFAVDLGAAGTQLAGDALLAAITGGSALVPMAARGFGSSAQEARQEGASLGQQVAYGAGSAALSVATEKIANVAAPLRSVFGKGALDDAISKVTGRLGQSAIGQTVLSALSEGGEEMLENAVQPILQRVTYNPNAEYDEAWLEDTLYQGLIGGVLGGALGGVGSININHASANAQQQAQQAAGATQTETAPNSTTQAQSGTQGVTETSRGQNTTLVGRVRQFIPQIQNMAPVSEVTGNEIPKSGKIVDRLAAFVNAIGNKVNRPGFGDVLFSRGRIKSSMLGRGVGQSKIETFAAVPDVIRNGQQIDYQQNWKGRGYDTYTFAAPITYRGQPTYLGVIVTKDSASNRYYLHEVVDANGDVIFRNDESPASTPDGTSSLSGDLDTVVETGDGAGTTPGTVDTVTDGRASQGVPVSDSTITPGAENVNSDPLVQILTGGQRTDQPGAVYDGLGAADAGSVNTDYDRLQAQSSQFFPEGANAARPVDVPTQDFQGNPVSRSASTVMGAAAIPDDVIPQIEQMIADGQLSYQRNTDQASLDRAVRRVQEKGFDGAMEEFRAAVNQGRISKDLTTLGQTLLNTAANNHDGNAVAEIMSLYQSINTNVGQAMQAMSILRKLSPESQLYGIRKMVDNLNDKLIQKINRKFDEIQIDPALIAKFTEQTDQAGRDAVMQEIYQNVADQVPSTWRDKWNAWRYLSMLGNPRTHVRNVVGNLGFQPLRAIKNGVAAGIESALEAAGVNVERTKSFGVSPSLYRAAWRDYENVADILGGSKYDDVVDQVNQRRRIFSNRLLEAARKANTSAMTFEDIIFKRITYADSLAGFLRANGVTAEQLESGNVNSELLQRARDYAGQEALKATYQDRNAISDRVDRIVRASGVVGDAILPFRRTPANILARGLEYSPAGLAKSIYDGLRNVRNGNKTAAQVIDEAAAGLTGSGLMVLGAYLFSIGVVTGAQGDDEDDKWAELLGHQGYALELPNGTSVTLDWLAPESLPFFMGVELASSMGEEGMDANAITNALKAVANPMLELSMLQSVNDLIDSVQYAEDSPLQAMIPTAIISYFTQAIPTLGGQIERTGEDTRMSTYTDRSSEIPTDVQYALGRASSRIPGWDYQQIPYIDVWGREEESGDPIIRALNNFVNPAYTSQVDVDNVEAELQRIRDATGDTSVFPDSAKRYIEVNGERKDLTAEEYQTYATTLGQTRYRMVQDAMQLPQYQNMTDAEKASYISDIYSYAGSKAKAAVSGYQLDGWQANADRAQQDLGISPAEYIALYEQYGSSVMSGSGYEKTKQAVAAGMTIDEYVSAKNAANTNGKSGVNKEEAMAYLDSSGYTRSQKADLWDIINTTGANNPYA